MTVTKVNPDRSTLSRVVGGAVVNLGVVSRLRIEPQHPTHHFSLGLSKLVVANRAPDPFM